MVAIDTNLLYYAHDCSTREHTAAARALSRAAESGEWGIALGAATEFWSLATRPESSSDAARVKRAQAFLAQLLGAGASLWVPGKHFGERLFQLATLHAAAGIRIYDLQIALTSLDNGANQLWTHDRRFPALSGLQIVDPL